LPLPYRRQRYQAYHDPREECRQCKIPLTKERSHYTENRPNQKQVERVKAIHQHGDAGSRKQEKPQTIDYENDTALNFTCERSYALNQSDGEETDPH